MSRVVTHGISSNVLPRGLLSVGPCPKKKDKDMHYFGGMATM